MRDAPGYLEALSVLPLVGQFLCELVARVAEARGSPSMSPTALDSVPCIHPTFLV